MHIKKNYTYLIKRLLEYLQDTGISVRKRVIKIFRDICLEQPDFSKIPEMCVKMIRRVNDEEGIKVKHYIIVLTEYLIMRIDVYNKTFDM